MSTSYLGQIVMFGGNFAIRGWAFCDGQLIAISQNQALFSILGTTYGGDGRTTFGLPDLRGRMAMHPGNGPGLPSYRLGQKGGHNTTTLNATQLPAHNHPATATATATLHAEIGTADKPNPTGAMLGGSKIYRTDTTGNNAALAQEAITASVDVNVENSTGGGRPVDVTNPYCAVNYIISLQGIFPSRS